MSELIDQFRFLNLFDLLQSLGQIKDFIYIYIDSLLLTVLIIIVLIIRASSHKIELSKTREKERRDTDDDDDYRVIFYLIKLKIINYLYFSQNERRIRSQFTLGTKVEAKYKGHGNWYKGTVTRVNHDGTIDITYEDGEVDSKLNDKYVKHFKEGQFSI